MPKGRTRYFLFTKVNPQFHDEMVLKDTCQQINAFVGYTIIDREMLRKRSDDSQPSKRKKVDVLCGFLVLRGPITDVGSLAVWFPNFILSPAPASFNMACIPGSFSFYGKHPFKDVKRNLFEPMADV